MVLLPSSIYKFHDENPCTWNILHFLETCWGWLHQAAPNTKYDCVIAKNLANARSSCLDGPLIEKERKKILAHAEFVEQKSLISPREISNEKKIASLLL